MVCNILVCMFMAFGNKNKCFFFLFCFTFGEKLHKNNCGDIIKSGINYMHWVCVRHKVPKLKHTQNQMI